MTPPHPPWLIGLARPTLILLCMADAARAQVSVTGHHDNGPNPPGDGNGYDANQPGQTYLVSDPRGDTTFDSNGAGLLAEDSTVSVSGGAFNGNRDGLEVGGETVNVSGGVFSGNGIALDIRGSSTVSVSGGAFNGNGVDFFSSFNPS